MITIMIFVGLLLRSVFSMIEEFFDQSIEKVQTYPSSRAYVEELSVHPREIILNSQDTLEKAVYHHPSLPDQTVSLYHHCRHEVLLG